jgi:hypothetical protein
MPIPEDVGLDHIQASIFRLLNQPFPHLSNEHQVTVRSQYISHKISKVLLKKVQAATLFTAPTNKNPQKWVLEQARNEQHFKKI